MMSQHKCATSNFAPNSPLNQTRFINGIYTATTGSFIENESLLDHYQQAIEQLPIPSQSREELLKEVSYFLMGQRARYTVPNLFELQSFEDRAAAFEQGAEQLLDQLTQQLHPVAAEADICFDAIIATTTTGNIMPGLSYRLAARLSPFVHANAMLLDLGNVGCTGSMKALNLVKQLGSECKQILVVAVELPTTLINCRTADIDVWQANCTFGDGAAALWISSDPEQGDMALSLADIQYQQFADSGLDTIHWGHSSEYYTFKLMDVERFEQVVKSFVTKALGQVNQAYFDTPHWAIHPAGIAILSRLRRKLGMPKAALKPAIDHFERYSNMSSAGIVHILKEVAANAPVGAPINLLTMGAGFNVIHSTFCKQQ
ncbi:MAG: hypothetical protein AAF702_15955 [Chloroflexota bacterium]